MTAIIEVDSLSKKYAGGTEALTDVSLRIEAGEIIALLGPNGAGKTTLISIICGLVTPSGGTVKVDRHDIQRDWRAARKLIGLVPQEIALEPFETVINSVRFTRGLYGMSADDGYIEQVLRDLSLWDKRDAPTKDLSGGMKRRVLIAKALAHRPKVLFLDEPTAGVDVALRHGMWQVVERLRQSGVTIILTTHYLEEAEEMADRIGVIDKGRLLLVRSTSELMREFGKKTLTIEPTDPLSEIPPLLRDRGLRLENGALLYDYDRLADRTGIARLLADLSAAGIAVRDLSTSQSSLEEVFMTLVSGGDRK